MSACICNCDCHYEDNKDSIILQLKSKTFEAEQKLNNYICVDECNKQLKSDNLKLIEEKNNLEYQLKQSHEFYEKTLSDLRTENESLKEELENKKVMNKKLFEENENEQYIITFKEIVDKACKIEKQINENNNFSSDRRKSDNNLIQYRNILKKEEKILNDIDSNHTKESDNSNNIKHSYSSKSTSSSNISVNSFNSSNLMNTQNNVNKLKNNLCGQFELNKINNTTVKKSNFFSAKNFNHLNSINLNGNNSNLGQRGSMKLNYNNNAMNVYNIIYPIRTQQFIYYNNMNYNPNLIDNRPKVTNFLIYYP